MYQTEHSPVSNTNRRYKLLMPPSQIPAACLFASPTPGNAVYARAFDVRAVHCRAAQRTVATLVPST
eukprot:1151333-Pleurochrysis_carterae.AAC.1